MTEEGSPVTKKGRGRPRKTEAPVKSPHEKKKPVKEKVELPPEPVDDTTDTEEDVPPPPAKSTPGKKRAAAAVTEPKEQDEVVVPAPKRGRGRPRKGSRKPGSTSVRGRGRPPKNAS